MKTKKFSEWIDSHHPDFQTNERIADPLMTRGKPYSPTGPSEKALNAASSLINRLRQMPKDPRRLQTAFEAVYEAARQRNLVPKIAVSIFQAASHGDNVSIVSHIARKLSELKTNQRTLDELTEVFIDTLVGPSSGPAATPHNGEL